MLPPMAARIWRGHGPNLHHAKAFTSVRYLNIDSRQRLSNFWAPTIEIEQKKLEKSEDGASGEPKDNSYDLLSRAGYLRQVHSGVFHLLPLGLRVQNKLEALIDKHMHSVGAAKVSLSSISTEALWKKSGRYDGHTELLRVEDRKDSGFLLAPTHEEEITSVVAASIKSYRDLPLRLYQIGRKYRDERRPRKGLLRAKEFVMKDLYTFDSTHEQALETYEAVRNAYNNLFDELNIPYTVAEADSGNMGGKLSHEYHFIHSTGEDKIWSCTECKYVANEELVEHKTEPSSPFRDVVVFTAISKDHKTRINTHIGMPTSKDTDPAAFNDFINPHAIRKAAESLGVELATGLEPDTVKRLLQKTNKTVDIYDIRLRGRIPAASRSPATRDIAAIRPGDGCPKCETGKISPAPGIEVGHTFHLGTRYSEPLNAVIAVPDHNEKLPVHMGCHGIGVSRLIGAAAAVLHDEKGLNWPVAIAPFEAVIVAVKGIPQEQVEMVYDDLQSRGVDVVIDDRPAQSLGWKLKDADMIGYPVIVVMGSPYKKGEGVELQCRRLGYKEMLHNYSDRVPELLHKLSAASENTETSGEKETSHRQETPNNADTPKP